MPVSLNVLGYTVQQTLPLLAWVGAARPPYTLVMDDLDLARGIEAEGTQVIFRRYRTDDHRLQDTLAPAAFLDSVADVPASYIVQAGNEPNGDQTRLVEWTVELMRLATARGRRLAVGNWSVGNPDDEATRNGLYDPLLRALAGSPHLLSVHEYFHSDPLNEPYFIGRYRMFRLRAELLLIPRPRIVVTEHGRDLGGGAGDGWRGQGWSEAQYADRLDAAQQVYRADGVTACVFGYGRGFDDRWQSFNVEGAATLLARMARMNGTIPEENPMPLPDGWKQVRITSNSSIVNIRALPSLVGRILVQVPTGYAVRPNGLIVTADRNRWQPVLLPDCRQGFISLDVSQLV